METRPAADDDLGPIQYEYFMIRSRRRGASDSTTLSGLVEHLATGEKRRFDDGRQLLKLLSNWSEATEI
jgi:hypothetical protein